MTTASVSLNDELQTILRRFNLDPQKTVERALYEHLRNILLVCPLTSEICLYDGSCNKCLEE